MAVLLNLSETAVPVTTEPTLEVGSPVKVLDAKYFTGATGITARTYDVSRDGRRFSLIRRAAGDDVGAGGQVQQMVIVLNWRDELGARLGPGNK